MLASLIQRLPLAPYLICVAIAPFVTLLFGAQAAIFLVFASGLFVVFAAFHVYRQRVVQLGTPHLLALALVMVCTMSALVAPYTGARWWGLGFEFGTFGAITLFVIAFLAGAGARKQAARIIPFALVVAAVIVSMCLVAVVVLRIEIAPLTKDWPVTALLFSIALAVSAHYADRAIGSRILYGVAPMLLIAPGLWSITHPAAWYVLIASACCGFALLVRSHARPFATSVAFLFGVTGLLYATHQPLVIAAPDIRPSAGVTEAVIVPTLFESTLAPLFGVGPNGFSAAWSEYKPLNINSTLLWDTSFTEGFSSALTLLATAGLFGFALFCFLVGVSLYHGARHDSEYAYVLVVASGLVVGFFMFAVGTTMFVFLGLCLGVLMLEDGSRINLSTRRALLSAVSIAGFGALICIVAVLQSIATLYTSRAAHLSNAEQAARIELYESAVRYWGAPEYERHLAVALMDRAARTVVSAANDEVLGGDFSTDVARSISIINDAVTPNVRSYVTWIDRAAIYVTLVTLRVEGAEHEAHTSLNKAAVLSPTSPRVPYLRALLAYELGDMTEARTQVRAALRLKPDYEDALVLQGTLRTQ